MKLLWWCCLFLLIGSCQLPERKVTVNDKSTVVYRGVLEKDAQRLGQVLLDYGYFNTWDERTVYLGKKDKQFTVTFLLNKEQFLSDQENMVAGFTVWYQWIRENAFDNAPTLLLLADEQRQTLYKIDSTTVSSSKSQQ